MRSRILLLIGLAAGFQAAPRALPSGFTETAVATGLDVTFLTAVGDGRIFVNEKHGVVRVIKNDKLLATPLLDISSRVIAEVERGLLGIAVDPAFADNGYVYLFHNDKDNHGYITRYTVTGDVADPSSAKQIFDLGVHGAPYHHGGDVHFGPDGKLYFTQGNGAGYLGDANTVSQNKNDLLGSIMRINPDGTIPTDNPFYAQNTGSARAVWTYGNRNSFNVRFQPGTGLCYFSDVQDDNTNDEVDQCIAGGNYGYGGGPSPIAPIITYGLNGAAQIGGAWYSSTQFPADYQGLWFFGNSGNGNIKTLDPKTHKVSVFESLAADCAISMDVSPDGSLYASTRCGDAGSVNNGKVWKFSYPAGITGVTPPASPELRAREVMQWDRPSARALSVRLLRAGRQELILCRPDGTVSARVEAEGPGPVALPEIAGPGLRLLVWRAGGERWRAGGERWRAGGESAVAKIPAQ